MSREDLKEEEYRWSKRASKGGRGKEGEWTRERGGRGMSLGLGDKAQWGMGAPVGRGLEMVGGGGGHGQDQEGVLRA